MKNIISAENLSLGYDHSPVVTDVHLHIHPGEFIGILGPNGSGKSTFFKTLLGFLKPLAGKITVLGRAPQHGNTHIGYMPQTRGAATIAKLTSRALLDASYRGTTYGLPLPSRAKKMEIDRVLHIVKAETYADRSFQQLSGGEKQRIYLAQALLGSPRILLLDEPLSNLDPHYQDIFVHLLHHIREELRVTILFTAHDPNPLLRVMNRVLFFANKKAMMGTVADIITSKTLSTLYETPIDVIQLKNRLFVLSNGQNILGEVGHQHD